MIEIVATVESLEQAKALLPVVDTIYFGEETFALRLPHSFTREEQRELVQLAHQAGKKTMAATNALMHPEQMKLVPEYLAFLKEIEVDQITIGEPGIIFVMEQNKDLAIPFVYAAETLVTSARQINFWCKKGAIGAVLAREVPFEELKLIEPQLEIPAEVLVYGGTCIHHSKRPLLENYYNFTKQTEGTSKKHDLFISEPKKDETHYSIFEDNHGTHIYANNDLSLIKELHELAETNLTTWKLDGMFTPGEDFVAIAKLFNQARQAIENDQWTAELAEELSQKVIERHPKNRGLDTGFYYVDPKKIK
ncbi:peptidase U32 [Enterococcus alcedinis]|uniref:Peptidase U32 n=1 Tax=Enterococcus alcedinis TaxID=1274384 RepID=A0A917JIJ6_9ENTE|nr:peptidase U32 family protein [Enterococcus alcedinis]MBP2102843.1 collagenase-like PrtC family protease [Enterococcus alcedinis]GGI66495.1 peptidase U32 [Enterococcus alcedinis]